MFDSILKILQICRTLGLMVLATGSASVTIPSKNTIDASTVFAARFYASAAHAIMRSRGVRVSATFLHSVKTNKDIFEFFFTITSHTIVVFPYQTGWRYSDGNPVTGASNARAYEKMTIFDQYLALSQKRL